MKKLNIACYMRYNDSEKLSANIKEMCDYANKNDYNIEKVIAEKRSGMSTISDDFYNLIANPEIDIIITPHLACITRNGQSFIDVEKKIKDAKKSIICLSGDIIE